MDRSMAEMARERYFAGLTKGTFLLACASLFADVSTRGVSARSGAEPQPATRLMMDRLPQRVLTADGGCGGQTLVVDIEYC
jgi:hypothetical protein